MMTRDLIVGLGAAERRPAAPSRCWFCAFASAGRFSQIRRCDLVERPVLDEFGASAGGVGVGELIRPGHPCITTGLRIVTRWGDPATDPRID